MDRRALAGDAVEHGVALDHRAAARDLEARLDPLIQVAVVEGESGLAVRHVNQSFVDGERSNRGREVAAVAAVIDERPIDGDLAEEIVDIHAGPRARAHHHHLAERGNAAAHAVELAPVRVGAAEGGEEERVPTRPLRRQVAAVEEEALAGAAPHEDGGERDLAHRDPPATGGSCAPPRRDRRSGRRPRPASPRWSPYRCGSRGRRSRPPRRGRGSSRRRC